MAVDDRTRLNLHRKLEAVLGAQEADTLMAHLPPVTWHDVATKDDLRILSAELRTEIAGVRTEVATEIAGVRTEIGALRTEVATEIAGVRIEIATAIDRQTRWIVTFVCAWSAVVLAAARLIF